MKAWKQQLERTKNCVAIERFGSDLTVQERDHLAHCARCEAEMALWQEFRAAEPAAEDGAAVQWIVAETRRRLKVRDDARRPAAWREWFGAFRPRTVALAATLLMGVAVGYVALERSGPSITNPVPGGLTYRSGGVQLLGPAGDTAAPPLELRWAPAAGADRYDAEVREVDGTVIWRISATETHVVLPASVTTQFVPGRTFLWRVVAKTSDGAVVAESETGRFRVPVSPRNPQ